MRFLQFLTGNLSVFGTLIALSPDHLPWYAGFVFGGFSAMITHIWMEA